MDSHPGGLCHADEGFPIPLPFRRGQAGLQPDGECLLRKAGLRLRQQGADEFRRLRRAPALQPQDDLVPVQPQGCRPAAGLRLQVPAPFPHQLAQLLQDHVAEHDAIFLVDLLQPVQEQDGHDALRPVLPLLRQRLEAGIICVKAGDAVHGVFLPLGVLPLLLLLDVPDTAHQLPALPVGVVDRFARQGHPQKRRILRPFQPELRVQLIGLALQGLHGLGPVGLVDAGGVDEAAPIAAAAPLSAHGGVVDDVQNLAVQVVGEKDVLGGLQSHLVPLLLLQENVFRLPLPLRQVHHHAVELVNLKDVGGLEVPEARRAAADAVHQPPDGPGQVPHRQVDAQYAYPQADEHGAHHPDIQPVAHAEEVLLRVQPQQDPLGVLIGHVAAVELQGAFHGVDPLAVEPRVPHPAQVPVGRLLQGEAAVRGADQVVEDALAHQGPAPPVPTPDGQQIARLLGSVELRHGEVVEEALAGDLHPQHAVDPAIVPQGNGVGDHFVGVVLLLFQAEGGRPVAQIRRVRLRMGLPRPPGLVEIAVAAMGPRPVQAEPGGPVSVQGDVPGPGQLLAPPLQEQVGVVGGVGVGVGVPDEEAVAGPRLPGLRSRQEQEYPRGIAALQDVQARGKQQGEQLAPPLVGAEGRIQPLARLRQVPLQDLVQQGLLLVDGGPPLVHVVLQHHAPVFHQAAHHAAGILLQGPGDLTGHQGSDGDGPLEQHDADQGDQEHPEDGRFLPF